MCTDHAPSVVTAVASNLVPLLSTCLTITGDPNSPTASRGVLNVVGGIGFQSSGPEAAAHE